MRKEDIMNTNPDRLGSDACAILKMDASIRREYEAKWKTEVKCKVQKEG